MARLPFLRFGGLFGYPNAPGYKARETSRAAALAAAPMSCSTRAQIYDAIKEQPDTPEGISKRLKIDILNVRPRMSELATKRKIEDSGVRGPSRGGQESIVWQVRA